MDYQEQKRRERRVQVPPLSYWIREEKEYVEAMTDIMDMFIIALSFLFFFTILFAIAIYWSIYWILPVAILMFVMWHMFWGKR